MRSASRRSSSGLAHVLVERLLVADRDVRRRLHDDGPRVDAAGPVAQLVPDDARAGGARGRRPPARRGRRPSAGPRPAAGPRTSARRRAAPAGAAPPGTPPPCPRPRPSRRRACAGREAILATTFDVPQPNEAESPVALRISSCRPRQVARAPRPTSATTRAQVEVALVDADLLHAPGSARPTSAHTRARVAAVGGRVRATRRRPAGSAGAPPPSSSPSARRTPRLVARGGHDAAAVGAAADHEREAGELRVLQHLDGREEGVEVEVGDDPAHRGGRLPGRRDDARGRPVCFPDGRRGGTRA